ncbi:basigin isoform 2-T3 [Leptodactylus fuscus]|uniref:basigin isoform X2 n=1 Tax=Leptodactylus fuscus TaxID=238119 RepID=UPI003F4E8BE5
MKVFGLLSAAVLLVLSGERAAGSAGFIKSPLSEVRLTGESVALHCEAIGRPMPEIQWWFEADYSNESFSQLWDGAREDRVQMNATYVFHAASTLNLFSLNPEDSGTYECRASNDPDRNHLTKSPRIKWIRSQANVIVLDHPRIKTSSPDGLDGEILMCNLTDPSFQISGHQWLKGLKLVHEDKEDSQITTYNITEVNAESSGQYTCKYLTTILELSGVINVTVPPHVLAYKKSEHGNEGDTGVLTCKSGSFPPVEQWMWYKSSDDGILEPIVNGTEERYLIKSTGNKTELRIHQLDIEKDQGEYICNGSNVLGITGATVALRVRSRLAALWPFLGIVAEVLILVAIIFIYEKRRKPDEAPEDEDGGSAPLKSNAGANHENVRQRNSS